MERAIMTGITRVSKESMFSDLNNLNVVTLTSDEYASAFGFTEEEVFAALDIYGMSKEKEKIKKWNGKQADPESIIRGKNKDGRTVTG